MKMACTAPREGFEPAFLSFKEGVLTISISRISDVITHSYLCMWFEMMG